MFGKCINSLKTIKWTDFLLFTIIIFLFINTTLLYNINRTLNWIKYDAGAITSNTYSTILLQLDNDNKDLDSIRFKNAEQKIDKLDKLLKNR